MAQLKRVTMQDIADACGLSRNTVSKVFNGRGAVPDATKELVLAKAQELGYRMAPGVVQAAPSPVPSSVPANRNIALLAHSKPSLHNFGSVFLTNFTDQICRFGYNLKIFEISEAEYANLTLPSHFSKEEISGIVVIELFDRDYTKMLCGMGLPVMLIDSYVTAPSELMECDLVYMENYASSLALTQRMINAGAKSIGFVGDIDHCSSFRERWNGFCTAMMNAGLPVDRSVCIMPPDTELYGDVDWMFDHLDALPTIPDGFVCCNDYVGIRVMQALRRKGFSVPDDVMVTGFDGTMEAEVVSPSLTTSKIPSAEIGRIAADMLLERIKNPEVPYRTTFVKTTPIWRESTRDY